MSETRIRPLLLTVLFISLTAGLFGEESRLTFPEVLPEDAARRGEELTVKLLTVGQGDPIYVWFGHIALIVEDRARDRTLMFDYGVFDFEQENFYTNFAMGRLYYRAVASYLENRIASAEAERRSSRIMTLDIPPEKRYALYSFLLQNVQPEYTTYLYHHYYDNCSTRIRDAIDHAVDGQLKEFADQVPSAYSYREHIRRYTGDNYATDFLLNFLQSGVIDGEITVWDEMFLPDRLEKALIDFTYTDSSGSQRKLVTDPEVLTYFPQREPVPDQWHPRWPGGLLAGSLWALLGLAAWMRMRENSRRSSRMVFGAYQSVTGLVTGSLGTALLFMMLATDHDVTFGNVNIMLANPLGLIIAVAGLLVFFGRSRGLAVIRWCWMVSGTSSLLLLFLSAVSIFSQHNQLSIAVLAPVNIIMGAYALYTLRARHKEAL